MPARIWLSVSEWLKKQPFELLVPAYYHPNMPRHLLEVEKPKRQKPNPFTFTPVNHRPPPPLYTPDDPHQLMSAAYTTEVMIEMYIKKIHFKIRKDEDVVEIFDGLDRYLLSLKREVELGHEEVIAYTRHTIGFRAEIYKHYFRYMNLNPAAKEKLYPNNSLENNIYTLLEAIYGKTNELFKTDPLRARKEPPYDIDLLRPNGQLESKTPMQILESSLGLSKASKFLEDDTGGFNFDAFMKG